MESNQQSQYNEQPAETKKGLILTIVIAVVVVVLGVGVYLLFFTNDSNSNNSVAQNTNSIVNTSQATTANKNYNRLPSISEQLLSLPMPPEGEMTELTVEQKKSMGLPVDSIIYYEIVDGVPQLVTPVEVETK